MRSFGHGRKRPALLVLATAGLALISLMSQTAYAADASVSIVDFAFNPASAKVSLGGTVTWTNDGSAPHTATSDGTDSCCPNGPALFRVPGGSGNLTHGQSGAFTFTTAGSYPYHCSIHTGMKGTIKVVMKANPTSGGTGTTFTITWAKSMPSGFTMDVMVKGPMDTAFQVFRNDTTDLKGNFMPNQGVGTYQFKSLLTRTSTGKSSGFSPVRKIQVA